MKRINFPDDPYVIPGTLVLKNKFGISDLRTLAKAEAEHTAMMLMLLQVAPLEGNFDEEHLFKLHKFIFRHLYSWAGEPRTINIEKSERILGGNSIEYGDHKTIEEDVSALLAAMKNVKWNRLSASAQIRTFAAYMTELWKIHPFREGNTRTVVTFCLQYAKSIGLELNQQLFAQQSQNLRVALVAAAASFGEIGDRSKPQYLIKFLEDALIEPVKKRSIQSKIEHYQRRGGNKDHEDHEIDR